ncbi:ice-binding family protein [Pontibacter oryzae]|uniref:DUF3494 domain-containing protein n=1 Tax=Pontibacter oryzae TaxID=2304593 RepID=A0A399S647_9BACT|nr:ice-binding family protein [Pontibacter oryzae]RIJ37542.1 DUF3494 domain-containing protein [Pontibacter oryzae]
MRRWFEKVILPVVCFWVLAFAGYAQQAPSLGALYEFSAVSPNKILSSGNTVVHASMGVSNGTVVGFPPGQCKREIHQGNQLANQAVADAATAFDFMANQANTGTIGSGNISGTTITPGVYTINGNANLNGKLTLNGQGQDKPVFIIKIQGNFNLVKGEYELLNNAAGINLFWVVEGEVQVHKSAAALGNIFSRGNIVMQDGAQLQGRLISRSGEIQLSNNTLNHPADLMLTLSKTPGSKGANTYAFGETVTYTIKVRNNGPTIEDGVVVSGVQYTGEMQSYTSSRPGSTFNGTNWVIGTLNYKEEATLNIVAKVNQAGAGYLRALVYGFGIDEIRDNNTGDLNFCVLLSETGEIAGPVEVCRNENFVYSIAPVEGATRYSWSVPSGWSFTQLGQTSIRVTPGSNAGAIKVTASNTCGEGPARTLEVTPMPEKPAQPSPIQGPAELCVGAKGITYLVPPTEYASSYTWSLPAGWSFVSGEGTNEIVVNPGTTGGTISVIAKNTCGDSEPRTIDVIIQDNPPTPPAEILGAIQGCVGSTVNYEVEPVPGVSYYNWAITGDWQILSGQGTRAVTVRVGTVASEISVSVQNACGQTAGISKAIEPVTAPTPAPGQITGPAVTCLNQNGLEYSISAMPTATSYTWSVPSGWSIVSGQGTTSIIVNAGNQAGKITVVAVNACGPSESSALAVEVTTEAPTMPGPITGTVYGCVGKTTTYTISDVAGAVSYSWSVPSGWSIVSGQGTTSIEVQVGSQAGKVTVTANNGCGAGATRDLDVNPQTSPPAAPAVISGPAEVCEGVSGFTYSVTPIAGVSSYNWTVPADWVILSGQGTNSITIKAGATAGSVSVAAVNDCGESAKASIAVTVVPSPPDKPGAITGLPSVCTNQPSITYSIDPVPYASSYIWSVGGNGWSIVSGQGSTSIVVNAGATGTTITVKAVNACGVTGETQLATVVTAAVPQQPGPITGTTIPCVGKTYTFSIDAVKDAYKYIWSVPAGWKIIDDKGTSIVVETGATAGTVRVTADNSCGAGPERTLQVSPTNTAPAAPKAILGNPDACAKGEAIFSVEAVAGASSYTWQVPADWTITSGQGSTSVKVQVGTTPGTIRVTSGNDCGDGASISREIILNTASPLKPGTITGNQQGCSNATVTYSIDPVKTATGYTWSVPSGWVIVSGQGTTSITVQVGTGAGNVSVSANNSCGNSSASALAVVAAQDVPPSIGSIITPAGSFCQQTAGLKYSVAPVSGAQSYTWEVPTGWTITAGQGTNAITVTAGAAAGKIKVAAVNACGTGSSTTVDVVPQTSPVVPQLAAGPANPCIGSSSTYSVTSNTNIDSYFWEVPAGWVIVSGQNTATLVVIATATGGKIKVTAKNSCGDSGKAEMEVVPSTVAPLAPGAILGESGLCVNQELKYTLEHVSANTVYTWAVPAGWQIVSGQGTGTITVRAGEGAGTITVAGSNGCGSTSPVSLNVAAMPAEGATAILDSSNPCEGLSYEVEPVPGATTYTWQVPAGWVITSGQNTPKITVTPGMSRGDISLVVSNGGCTDEPLYIAADPALALGELNFPNVFSPNGDGNNDTWVIQNLRNYPDNEVTVINRWGNQVYNSKSYKDNWGGDNLSEGTYFYVVRVKMCDGQDKMYKGYVMIVR